MPVRLASQRRIIALGLTSIVLLAFLSRSNSYTSPRAPMMSWLQSLFSHGHKHHHHDHGNAQTTETTHDLPSSHQEPDDIPPPGGGPPGSGMPPIGGVPYISGPEFSKIAHGRIRFCAQAILPFGKEQDSAATALQESPRNGESPSGVTRYWRTGRTLRIAFLGGSENVQNKVKRYATVWTQYANIRFEFVTSGPAEIRVDFETGKGSWSFVGTDNLLVDEHEPNMNLGWLNDESTDREIKSLTLHEFGHALGLEHKFLRDTTGVQWYPDVVYVKYAESQEWFREVVDEQVFNKFKEGHRGDPSSIMEFPIPKEFTKNKFEASLNEDLSQADIAEISALYPRDSA